MAIPSPAVTGRRCEMWYIQMAWMRTKRRENVREKLGRHFGVGDYAVRVSNVIFEETQTLRPKLIPEDIKARVDARFPDLDFDAEIFKMRLDDRLDEIDLALQVELAVDDAIDGGIGCILIGETGGEKLLSVDNCEYRIGETFGRAIDPDDLVCDTDARTVEESRCFGHKVRIDANNAVQLGMYGRDPEELAEHPELAAMCMTRKEAADYLSRTPSLATSAETTTADIGGAHGGYITVNDILEVWETVQWFDRKPYRVAYRARGDKFLTDGDKYLLIEPYDGPEGSAYHFLVPIMARGSIIGLAYSSSLRDVHEAAVKVSRKIVQATLRSKRQGTYARGEAEAAMTLRDAPDGEFVAVTDPKGINTIELGGIHKDTMAGYQYLMTEKQKASGSATRSDSGGIADTASEASILAGIQQSRDSGLTRVVKRFIAGCVRSVAWYEYFNPLATWVGNYPTPGGPVAYEYGPDLREGDSLTQLYKIDADITSVQMADPVVQSQRLVEFVDLFTRSLPLMKAGVMDPRGLLSVGRETMGLRSLDRIFPDAERAMMMQPLEQQIQASRPQPTPTGAGQAAGQPMRSPQAPQPLAGGPSAARGPAVTAGAVQSAYPARK